MTWLVCRWVLELQCGGSRNLMSALRMTMENDEEQKHHICEWLLPSSPLLSYGHFLWVIFLMTKASFFVFIYWCMAFVNMFVCLCVLLFSSVFGLTGGLNGWLSFVIGWLNGWFSFVLGWLNGWFSFVLGWLNGWLSFVLGGLVDRMVDCPLCLVDRWTELLIVLCVLLTELMGLIIIIIEWMNGIYSSLN